MISISKLYCGLAGGGDSLRYGHGGSGGSARRPIVVWNCTSRCNLRCVHCYAGLPDEPCTGELSTAQAKEMLRDLADFGVPVILFSGGEPLCRPDVVELISTARSLGIRAVLSTNGTLIDSALADRLKQAGVDYIGVSLDGVGETNDVFRGRPGAFEQACDALRLCRQAGIRTGLRFTITVRNFRHIGGIFDLAAREEVGRICFYHLVNVGRAEHLQAGELDHDATRRTVDQIIDLTARQIAEGRPIEVLTVDNHADGPYLYLRMLGEGNPRASLVIELLRSSGGNASGEGIACVWWDGKVHPDQFWRSAVLGNVLYKPFSRIWSDESNSLLSALRDRRKHLIGRCASCRFLDACGGNFRVRALAATGNPWAADPACYLSDQEIAPEITADNL